MKLKALLLVIFLTFSRLTVAQSDHLASDQIDAIAKSVVQIVALDNGTPVSTGSGTIATVNGLIITNRHVVEDADDYLILLLDDVNEEPVPRYYASLVAMFDEIDFAVLEIDRDERGRSIDTSTLELPFIDTFVSEVHRGDRIFIFGYPGIGDGYLVFTEGIITTIRNGEINGERVEVWYQTNAEMAPGNSGGLVVNLSGELVGIPTAVRTEDQTGGRLGGILPIMAVQTLLKQLRDQPDTTSSPSNGSGGSGATLDFRLEPTFGSFSLQAGFEPDPYTIRVASGSEVNTAYLGGDCAAITASAPDFRLHWNGNSGQLRFIFVPDENASDPVLIVNDPDTSWHCNDNASANTFDPMVIVQNAHNGQYDIWIGSFGANRPISGTLYITERLLTP